MGWVRDITEKTNTIALAFVTVRNQEHTLALSPVALYGHTKQKAIVQRYNIACYALA